MADAQSFQVIRAMPVATTFGILVFFQPNPIEPCQSTQLRCLAFHLHSSHASYHTTTLVSWPLSLKSNQFEPCQLPQSRYLATSLSKHFQSRRSPYYRFLAFQPTALSSIELLPSVTTPSVLTFQPTGFNQSEPLTCYYDHGIWPSACRPFSATKATTTTTSVSGYQPIALPSHELLQSVSHHNLRCWLPAHRSTIIRATSVSQSPHSRCWLFSPRLTSLRAWPDTTTSVSGPPAQRSHHFEQR